MKLMCNGNGVGNKCSYTCDQGYTLVGANERECRSGGQWSHALPFCQSNACLFYYSKNKNKLKINSMGGVISRFTVTNAVTSMKLGYSFRGV